MYLSGVTEMNFTAYGTSCFTGDTLIATKTGLQRIDQIKEGEQVWSFNEESGKKELKYVTATKKSKTKLICEILVNGTKIYATPLHPFYTENRGWISAKDLETSDRLFGDSNGSVEHINIIHLPEDEEIWVYNITVQGNHNYFVTQNEFLVHNASQPANYEGITNYREKIQGPHVLN